MFPGATVGHGAEVRINGVVHVNTSLGAGVTDDSTAQGLTGSFGFCTKWYLGKWFAVRLDVRDHLLKETLIGEEHLVNDILVTGGFSIFIPFGG